MRNGEESAGAHFRQFNYRMESNLRRALLAPFLAFTVLFALSGCAHKQQMDYADAPLTYLVFFETWSADLTQDGYAIVQHAAEGIRKVRPQGVVIASYTSKIGSEKANQALSENRAEVVMRTLTDLGVDPAEITKLPLGEANDTVGPTGDRRIEIRLIKDTAEAPGPAVSK
jgi:outer membrane protein OmpA-like peptidoglycan-associated protein